MAIIERVGLKRTITATLLVLSATSAVSAFMTAPWQMMLLWGFIIGSGTGMVAMVLGAMIAGRWFTKNRGLVLGLLTASGAAGQLVFLPVLASLSDALGWRAISYAVAAATLVLVPFVLYWVRDYPADLNLPRYGDTIVTPVEKSAINPALRAIRALRQGMKSRDFWLLSATFFICGASSNGLVGTHMIALCSDHGIPQVAAAGMVAWMGIFNMVGTTGAGWLIDRFDSRVLLAWFYGLRGLSLMLIPYAFDYELAGLFLFSLFYGLDWIATVPPTVRLTTAAFGEADGPVIFGWILTSHQIGAALAAWLAGLARTEFGDYHVAFFSAGTLCIGAAILAMLIGSPRGKEKGLVTA